jgi:hypothetical protein
MRRAARSLTTAVFCLFALCGHHLAASSASDSLYRDLPRDPLVVLGISLNGPTEELGSLASIFDRLQQASGEDTAGGIMPDSGVLRALSRDLLPQLGPELALVVDLPPIDQLLSTMQMSPEVAAAQILGDVGFVARVRDGEAVAKVLRSWSDPAAPTRGEEARRGRLKFAFDAAEDSAGMMIELHYRIENGRLAMGFSPTWVEVAVKRRAKGARLGDGEDFKRVFANLDHRPADLTYVNLPKVRSHIVGSQLMRLALQSNPELNEFFDSVMT